MATEQFHYTYDDHEIVLPHLKDVKAGLMRKIRRRSPDDQLFTLLEAVAGDETLAVIDEMTAAELNTFYEEWQKASGITVGESTASSTT